MARKRKRDRSEEVRRKQGPKAKSKSSTVKALSQRVATSKRSTGIMPLPRKVRAILPLPAEHSSSLALNPIRSELDRDISVAADVSAMLPAFMPYSIATNDRLGDSSAQIERNQYEQPSLGGYARPALSCIGPIFVDERPSNHAWIIPNSLPYTSLPTPSFS